MDNSKEIDAILDDAEIKSFSAGGDMSDIKVVSLGTLRHILTAHFNKPTLSGEPSEFIDWLVENNKLDFVSASVIKKYIPKYYKP